MEVTVSYTFLALSAVILSLSPVALTFYRLKQYDLTQTISMHIATSRASYGTFALLFTAGSVLLYFLLVNWLSPQLQLPAVFGVIALLLLALQLIVAWLPDGKHARGYIHRIASFSMTLVMLLLLFYIIIFTVRHRPYPEQQLFLR